MVHDGSLMADLMIIYRWSFEQLSEMQRGIADHLDRRGPIDDQLMIIGYCAAVECWLMAMSWLTDVYLMVE